LKETALLAVKIGVSLALLGYLLVTTDLEALLARVRAGDMLLLVAAVLLYTGMILLSMWRWRVLISAQGYPAPIRHLSASYLVATFFNNFLPSNIGGDVVRHRCAAGIDVALEFALQPEQRRHPATARARGAGQGHLADAGGEGPLPRSALHETRDPLRGEQPGARGQCADCRGGMIRPRRAFSSDCSLLPAAWGAWPTNR